MASRVFLIQASRRPFDLTTAQAFGEVVPVLQERDSPSVALAPALVKIRQALRDYDPQTDYLLAAGGDQLASFLAGAILTEDGHLHRDAVSWLRWDRHRDDDGRRFTNQGEYVPVRFNLKGQTQSEWTGRG